jgi:phasin
MSTATAKAEKTMKAATAATKEAMSAPFEAFNINMPTVEVPAVFRDFAEKGIAQARDAYAKMKTAAEEATDMVEDTYETAREGAFAIGVKALDAAKSNTDASFALARDLFGARTFAEVIELQTAFARKQFDTVAAQVKELQDLTAKFVTDTAKPVTSQVEKTFKDIKAA